MQVNLANFMGRMEEASKKIAMAINAVDDLRLYAYQMADRSAKRPGGVPVGELGELMEATGEELTTLFGDLEGTDARLDQIIFAIEARAEHLE